MIVCRGCITISYILSDLFGSVALFITISKMARNFKRKYLPPNVFWLSLWIYESFHISGILLIQKGGERHWLHVPAMAPRREFPTPTSISAWRAISLHLQGPGYCLSRLPTARCLSWGPVNPVCRPHTRTSTRTLGQGRINLFGAPRQWKYFRPLFQAVFLSRLSQTPRLPLPKQK